MQKNDLQQDHASSLWRRYLTQTRIHMAENMEALSVTQIRNDSGLSSVMSKKMGRSGQIKEISK